MAKGLSPWYDINFVASKHLRDWMVTGGVAPEKVQVSAAGLAWRWDGVLSSPMLTLFVVGLSQVLHVGVIVDDYGRNLIARQLLRDELKVKEQTTVVTLAARLDENKQPGILCHVATDIVKTQKFQGDVHFLVAGSGDQRLALKKCIRSKKLKKKFTMLGYVSLEGMKEVLSASDVLFLPSQMEGIPCVFYEAMAAGIPVIGPGDGGIAELVHNDVTG